MAKKDRMGELSFFEHLDELRDRIVRCLIYVCVGSGAGWAYREQLMTLLRRPAEVAAHAVGMKDLPFRVFEPMGGLMIALQVSMVAGLVFASPLIIWELWRFTEPALERGERKYAIAVIPAAIGLFLGGVVFCYFVSPAAFRFFFLMDQSLGVTVERTLQPYLWFIMRMMLGFGLAFELPLILMFAGFIGVVTARQLVSWWRYAIVVIFLFAAIVTPTVDPVNMTILAAPLFVLYAISIGLVALVQKKRKRDAEAEAAAGADREYEVAAAPAGDDPSAEVYREARAEAGNDEPEVYRRDMD